MHLLGTSVLVFLLLPLVLSCKSTKNKEEISEDYKNIIQKQLENINLSIQSQVTSCMRKKPVPPNHLPPVKRICNVSWFHLPRNISDHLQTELSNLRRDIIASVGCSCNPSSKDNSKRWPEDLTLQRKWCHLKHLLMKIQSAYEQHNSAP